MDERSSRRHLAVLVLVAVLHAMVAMVLWQHRLSQKGQASQQRASSIRLVVPSVGVPRQAHEVLRPTLPTQASISLPVIPPPTITVESQSNAQPSISALPSSEEPSAAAAADQPRTTLRLTLPPGYAASSAAHSNPATRDPRSNSARRTTEDRIADAAGASGDWIAERTSDSRTVMRRGDTCVEVFKSRIADSDAFNGNVAPRTAAMTGNPYKCR